MGGLKSIHSLSSRRRKCEINGSYLVVFIAHMPSKLSYFGRIPINPQWPQVSRTIPPPCWATWLFGHRRSSWPSQASSAAAGMETDQGPSEHGPAPNPGGFSEHSPFILEHVSNLWC